MIQNAELDAYKQEAVQLTAEIQGAFEQLPTQHRSENLYSVVFNEICDNVVERGLLSEEQLWEIDKVADDVVRFFETPPTPKSEGGDGTDPFSKMFDWYLGFEAQPLSRTAVRELTQQNKEVSLEFKSFFGIVDQVRQAGGLLLNDQLLDPIINESASVGSMHNANVLKTIAILDIITTVHQARPLFDRGEIIDANGKAVTPETLECMLVGAASESVGSKSDPKILRLMLADESKQHIKGLFRRVPAGVKQQLDAIEQASRRYFAPRAAVADLDHNYWSSTSHTHAAVLETLDKAILLGGAFKKIDSILKTEVETSPDTDTVLGALAVENWRHDLLQGMDRRFVLPDGKRVDLRLYFEEWQAKPFHLALTEAESEAKRQANREAIQTIDTAIGEIETKFEVTGKKLRELPGGLALRKNIMDIVDNGSERAAFTEHEAQLLTGLVLTMNTDEAFEALRQALDQTGQLYREKRSLGGKQMPALFSAVNNVRELYEAGVLERLAHKSKETKNLELIGQWLERLDGIETKPRRLKHEPLEPKELSTNVPVNLRDALQHTEVYLPIKPFPPGEVTVGDIKKDFKEALERNGGSYVVEWERVEQFIGLHDRLVEEGYAVSFYRTKHSNWHPLPYYAIEVQQPYAPPIAIVESPIYGNATYFIEDVEWQTIIQFTRIEARKEFGAIGMKHPTENENLPSDYHIERVRKKIPPHWA